MDLYSIDKNLAKAKAENTVDDSAAEQINGPKFESSINSSSQIIPQNA